MKARITESQRANLWAKIAIREPDECWMWQAGTNPDGYGVILTGSRTDGTRRPQFAHRVVYFLTHGRWPEKTRHTCDNPGCCNPAHLLEGTHFENMQDKLARGRQPRGEGHCNAKLTEEQVRSIRAQKPYKSLAELSKMYGVAGPVICNIVNRKAWAHVTDSIGGIPNGIP